MEEPKEILENVLETSIEREGIAGEEVTLGPPSTDLEQSVSLADVVGKDESTPIESSLVITDTEESNVTDVEMIIEAIENRSVSLVVDTEAVDVHFSPNTGDSEFSAGSPQEQQIKEPDDGTAGTKKEDQLENAPKVESVTEIPATDVRLKEEPKLEPVVKSMDKKEKIDSLRYGEKGKPSPTTPKSNPRPDSDLLKMMKQSSMKLKSFDYSKLKGKKKESPLGPELSPASASSAPERYQSETHGNSLTPKKHLIRDRWLPPGGHFYEYDDLVAVNITKIYGDLQENHLEAYLTTADFEKVFEMKRNQFYELPPWRQQQIKKDKSLF